MNQAGSITAPAKPANLFSMLADLPLTSQTQDPFYEILQRDRLYNSEYYSWEGRERRSHDYALIDG
jgi:hypothetical protein